MVSEEQYIALRAQGPNASLKEFVQLKVYETLALFKQEISQSQGEGLHLHQQLIQSKSRAEKQELELGQLRQQVRDIKDDSERRVGQLERRNLDLES